VLYGSLVLEDMQRYSTNAKVILKSGCAAAYQGQQGSLLDGTAGSHFQQAKSTWVPNSLLAQGGQQMGLTEEEQGINLVHDSYSMMQRLAGNMRPVNNQTAAVGPYEAAVSPPDAYTPVPTTLCVNLFSGFLSCQKLIPLKWLASQLALELEMCQSNNIFLHSGPSAVNFSLTDVSYVSEMFEFDSTYDAAFYQGLSTLGVPLKFSSWHYHVFNWTGNTMIAQIQERARSVKAILAVNRLAQNNQYFDSDRLYHAIGENYYATLDTDVPAIARTRTWFLENAGRNPVTEFQFRVGGRYYPAQPVKCTGGAGEALVELMKVMNYFADYTRAIDIDMFNWSSMYWGGGDRFIMAGCFENTDAFPNTISGMNAEEQSDIQLMVKYGPGRLDASTSVDLAREPTKQLWVFVNYDSLAIVRDGNKMELII
jgi:hypothetical protein